LVGGWDRGGLRAHTGGPQRGGHPGAAAGPDWWCGVGVGGSVACRVRGEPARSGAARAARAASDVGWR